MPFRRRCEFHWAVERVPVPQSRAPAERLAGGTACPTTDKFFRSLSSLNSSFTQYLPGALCGIRPQVDRRRRRSQPTSPAPPPPRYLFSPRAEPFPTPATIARASGRCPADDLLRRSAASPWPATPLQRTASPGSSHTKKRTARPTGQSTAEGIAGGQFPSLRPLAPPPPPSLLPALYRAPREFWPKPFARCRVPGCEPAAHTVDAPVRSPRRDLFAKPRRPAGTSDLPARCRPDLPAARWRGPASAWPPLPRSFLPAR